MTRSNLSANMPGQRELLLGNQAIARGALEAGMKMFSCYPGTPSSEVAEALLAATEGAPFPAIEYSVNEKVALEVACGAALAGVRSMAAMKHVGLNVAADPLFTAAYIGMPGGLVVLSADDPGCHSSQNEQDNRQYARAAGLPCLEPASAQEAKDMTKAAFDMAAELEQPVLLRTTTRISHLRGPVVYGDIERDTESEFARNAGRFVPVPAVALKRHRALWSNMRKAAQIADESHFNSIAWPRNYAQGEPIHGIIASGVARDYLADALALSGFAENIAVLELGMTWPLPEKLLTELARNCHNILVLEEGAPLLENDIRAFMQGSGLNVAIEGKDDLLSEFGEYSTSLVLGRVARFLGKVMPLAENPAEVAANLPRRPPNLCAGCAHRAVYFAARKVFGDEAICSSDIGCYTLGLLPPLRMADFLVCMGSSVSAGSGFARASGKTVLAFIGDSTFFHSGMTGLANAVFNRHNIIMIILDNGTTAMTGHQPNPGMHQDLLGDDRLHLDIESIVAGIGVKHCITVKAGNLKAVTEGLEELRSKDGVRVLIARESCRLHAGRNSGKKGRIVAQVAIPGDEAQRCMRELACPAFRNKNGVPEVDENMCNGCMFCLQLAPGVFTSRKI